VYLGVRTANHNGAAFRCRVCGGHGSGWERVLYELCDAEQLVQLYAAEAHSLDKPAKPFESEGVRVCPEAKRWDVAVAAPEGLLIEMQGEGHSSRLVAKPNSTDSSLAERRLKDWLYAQEAIRQGWSVLWLWVDERSTNRTALADLWTAQLRHAVAHVKAGGPPQLFVV
jgi:hypothetical protein